MYTCGYVVNFCELIKSESLKMVTDLIKDTLNISNEKIEICIYDNGCHLKDYIKNDINKTNDILKDIQIRIDRFHLNNHKKNANKTMIAINLIFC